MFLNPVKARRYVCWCVLFLFCLGCSSLRLHAQLPATKLYTVFPPGGKTGATFDVTVTGADLEEVTQLHFSNDGITAKAKPEANRFTVTIGANVSPGIYEARLAGRFGLSNPRAFAVGDLPEVLELPPDNSLTSPMAITLPALINGATDANAADYFKFAAKKGQRVLIECQDNEIDSRLNAELTVYDATGRELGHDRLGALVDLTAPADGAYIAKIHDLQFRGGNEYFYRLSIRTGPHIDYILPPAGQPGTKGKYTLYGRNLPGGTPANVNAADGKPLEQLTVEIELPGDIQAAQRLNTSTLVRPGGASLDGVEYRLKTPQGVSNPVLVSVATAPVMLKAAGNDQPQAAQKVTVPCEVAGQFYPRGNRNWFTFDAKKGEVDWLEVYSHRLGAATSPFLLVQRVVKNDKGVEQVFDLKEAYDTDANLGGNEFNTAHRDPAWRFEVKEDGTYRVQLTDLFNRAENNPALVYRLAIRREAPDFRLAVIEAAPLPAKADTREVLIGTPAMRRAETVALQVMAFREDGFGGEIDLSVEGLPAGVTYGNARIPAGQNSCLLAFTATENAAGWSGPVKILGKAKIADKDVVREARGGSVVWPIADFNNETAFSRMTRNVVFSTIGVETAPVSIQATDAKPLTAVAEIKVTVPLTITRRGDFIGALKLKTVAPSALEKVKELDIAEKATNATMEIDLAQAKLAPGVYTLLLRGQITGKYRNDPDGAKAAEDAAKAAEKTAADLAAAAKKAGEDAGKATGVTKAEADKLAKKAADKAKEAEAKKTEAVNRAKAATQRAQPREVTLTVYSAPIALTVNPAPAKPK